MSQVTVSQAAKLTGKSRETINSATKEGKLSHTRDAQNRKVIDVAELERVYPLVKTMHEITSSPATVSRRPAVSHPDSQPDTALLATQLAHAEEKLQLLSTERDRERRQLQDEIDSLRTSLGKAQEQHNKALLLITDQTQQTKDRASDWEASIKALEARLANHETRAEQDRERLREVANRKLRRLRHALETERARPWWQRLWR